MNPNPPRPDHDPRVNSSVGGMLAVVVASGASAAAVAKSSVSTTDARRASPAELLFFRICHDFSGLGEGPFGAVNVGGAL